MYSLGWIRLERFVEFKHLLFIRSIMAMNDDALEKTIFNERY